LLDTKPVPVLGYKRHKTHSQFVCSADYGQCAARHLQYFGFKLVLLRTCDGVPLAFDLVAATLDERVAAESVLYRVNDGDILADNGFIGADWQATIATDTGNCLYTPKRVTQPLQNSPAFDATLNALHECIEGVFHHLQNTGRHLERLLANTVSGLSARVTLKVTALVLRHLLARVFGFDLQSFLISH
jgi:hypothetical protein